MNLAKLFEKQRELDAHIIKKKGLQGKDLTANTYMALMVELSEFANEGRWFKHWSENRLPNTYRFEELDESQVREWNPLLEEFVDSVHFFLSLAIQKGWEDALYIFVEQLDPDEFDGDLTGYFLQMTYFLNRAYMDKHKESETTAGFQKNAFSFRMAWLCFLNIGINGFGFTLEQIEAAYMDKNNVNHERQRSGY